jgi:hypothetical protein
LGEVHAEDIDYHRYCCFVGGGVLAGAEQDPLRQIARGYHYFPSGFQILFSDHHLRDYQYHYRIDIKDF